MPTMQCPGCGKAVRFEGVAGVCPNCASVVRAPRAAPPAAAAGATPPAPPAAGRPRRAASVDDLQAVATGDEVFAPPTGAGGGGGGDFRSFLKSADPRLVGGVMTAAVLLVGFGLYTVLHRPTSTVGPVAVRPPMASPGPAAPPPAAVPEVPAVPSPPAVATTGPATRPAAVVLPAWYGLHPVRPDLPPDKFTDELVERALRRGVAFLKPKIGRPVNDPKGIAQDANGVRMGATCLATYALLHTGQAIDDPELTPTSSLMGDALRAIKLATPERPYETYGESLRAQALSLSGREADRGQLVKDQQYLLRAAVGGAYGYNADDPQPASIAWDHSNSQYGVLGVWAAAEAGLPAPSRYWDAVERHWVETQVSDGGWGYSGGQSSTTSMTAAGVTSLSVASEQEVTMTPPPPAAAGGPGVPRPSGVTTAGPGGVPAAALAEAVDRGLAFLGKGDNLLSPGGDAGYTLYGVERAALSTGFRFFGEHDWYRDLGVRQLAAQAADGSWTGPQGQDVGTSFRLLFLARGRQPLLMNKLKFAGHWNDRPRDVAKLVGFCSAQLERPFAWGVADLTREWWTWLDAPLIFMSVDRPPDVSDADVAKLRAYTEAGGFLVVHNEFASKAVDAWAADFARRLYPEYAFAKAAPGDLLYRALYPVPAARQPPLMTVSNGVRPLLVYSPTDLSRAWLAYRPKEARPGVDLQMGLNLFVAAAGKSEFRNRLHSPYVNAPDVRPVGTVPVQRVTYGGGHDNPEPAAFDRFGRWLLTESSVAIDPQTVDVKAVDIHRGPFAVLTGTGKADFAAADVRALSAFVRAGGTLVVDAAGGDKAFAGAVRQDLLPAAFGGVAPAGMPLDHPVLAGTGACMTPLPKPRLRKFAAEQLGITNPPGVQYLTYGSGTVIVSDLDLTTALLHSSTYGVFGYTPDYADALVKNALLWTLSRFQPPPATTGPTTGPAAGTAAGTAAGAK